MMCEVFILAPTDLVDGPTSSRRGTPDGRPTWTAASAGSGGVPRWSTRDPTGRLSARSIRAEVWVLAASPTSLFR